MAPAEMAIIPAYDILIREPAPTTEATTRISVPAGKGKALIYETTIRPPVLPSSPLEPLFSLPTPPCKQIILTKKELNVVLDEFGGDGQSTALP